MSGSYQYKRNSRIESGLGRDMSVRHPRTFLLWYAIGLVIFLVLIFAFEIQCRGGKASDIGGVVRFLSLFIVPLSILGLSIRWEHDATKPSPSNLPSERGWRAVQDWRFALALGPILFCLFYFSFGWPPQIFVAKSWTVESTEPIAISILYSWFFFLYFYLPLAVKLQRKADSFIWWRLKGLFEFLIQDSLVLIVFGSIAILFLLFQPFLFDLGFSKEDTLGPFWIGYVLSALLAWFTPAIKSLANLEEVFAVRFRTDVINFIQRAVQHRILLGFGDLGQMLYRHWYLGAGGTTKKPDAKFMPLVFPDGEVNYLTEELLVIERKPEIFSYTFYDRSGQIVGAIRPSQQPLRNDSIPGQGEFYVVGIVGDVKFPHVLEKASVRRARELISTASDSEGTFSVFDVCRDANRGATAEKVRK